MKGVGGKPPINPSSIAKTNQTGEAGKAVKAEKVKAPLQLPPITTDIDGAIEGSKFDPVSQLPAHGDIGTTQQRVAGLNASLKQVADASGHSELQSILQRASEACNRTAKAASVAAPVRVTLKEDPKRPSTLEGFLQRRTKGSGANKRTSITFRPKDRDFSPFAVPAEMVEGLPSGARLSVKLERTDDGQQHYAVVAKEGEFARTIVGNVVVEDGQAFVEGRGFLAPYARVPLADPGAVALEGKAVVVDVLGASDPGRVGRVTEQLGATDSASAMFLQFAAEAGRPLDYPADVLREVQQIVDNPRLDEGTDLTHLDFCTIDNDDSMDLDQAMCIEKRADGGYDLHYAIADTTHFIKPGGAIDKWAQRIGLTSFLPDRSLPIFPKVISEDLCSLVADKKRPAFVITVKMDAAGEVQDRSFQRGIIESRGKLSYRRVQKYHDAKKTGEYADKPYTRSLDLLEELGKKRIEIAKKRGVVPSDAPKTHIRPANPEASKFEIAVETRYEVEKWNEQISLLSNEAIAIGMRDAGLRSLHRLHKDPDPARVDAFRDKVAALGVPWTQAQPLSEYVRGLDPKHPMSNIIKRLATRINRAAEYSPVSGGHSALKLGAYDHFTAPMRRLPDILSARIFAAHLEGRPVPLQGPGQLEKLASRMDSAKRREGQIAGNSRAFMSTRMLEPFVGRSMGGQVIDVHPGGAVVILDDPPVEVLVSNRALAENGFGGPYVLEESGVALVGPEKTFRLGDAINVTIASADIDALEVTAIPTV